MVILLGLITGIAFGYVLQRSNANSCSCVQSSLQLRDMKVVKIIMTAIGVASLLVYPLASLGWVHLNVKATNVLANLVGGLIFGVGFAVAGYCPGTILASLGAGRKGTWWVVAGGLAGTLVYSLVYGVIKPFLLDPLSFGKLTLASVTGIPAEILGPLFSIALLVGAFYLDKLGNLKQLKAS